MALDVRFASITYVCGTDGMARQVQGVYDRLMIAYPASRLGLATKPYVPWHSDDPRK